MDGGVEIEPVVTVTTATTAEVIAIVESKGTTASTNMDVVENDNDNNENGMVALTSHKPPTTTTTVPATSPAVHVWNDMNRDLLNNIHTNNNNNIMDETTYPTCRLLHNDIPPSIQSLQQQYYSSSSLSGDEEDDDDDERERRIHHHHDNNDDDDDDADDEPLIQSNLLVPTTAAAAASRNLHAQQPQHPPPPTTNSNLQTIDPPIPPPRNNNNNNNMNTATTVATITTGGLTRMPSGSASSTQSGGSSSLQARSSQNSSRDWGWFDDVHATTHSETMMQIGGGGGSSNNNHHHTHRMTSRSTNPHGRHGAAAGGMHMDSKHLKNHVTIIDPTLGLNNEDDENRHMMMNAMAVTAPHYVLEESLSSQFLWKNSAGQRPPQPVEERAFYEKMWAQNFERSNVEYNMPVELLTATSPLSLDPFSDSNICDSVDYAHQTVGTVPLPMDNSDYHHHAKGTAVTDIAEAALVYRMNDDRNHHPYSNQNNNHPHNHNNALHNYHAAPVKREVKDTSGDGTLTVLVRGDNVFGTTVSKSFARTTNDSNGDFIPGGVDTINISIASYRVVESPKHGKFAQFLVIYRQGSIRDTIGIWKRYRDFEELAHKVTQAHEGCVAAFAHMSPLHTVSDSDQETEHLPNAITSWRLLKKRKRWYRCLDAGYLSLKVFLLERFLHDILFESSSPHLLRDFVGVDSVPHML